jgi:hypothetical protein
LELKDAGLVAADAAATVDGSAKIIDLGTGFVAGEIVIDVTAIEIASNDERYDITLQLSDSATFASGIVDRCCLSLGAHEVLPGDTDSATGRHTLPFNNRYKDETVYRYARLYTDVTGTIATGINYSAFAALRAH